MQQYTFPNVCTDHIMTMVRVQVLHCFRKQFEATIRSAVANVRGKSHDEHLHEDLYRTSSVYRLMTNIVSVDEFLWKLTDGGKHVPKYNEWPEGQLVIDHVRSFMKENATECAYLTMKWVDDELFAQDCTELLLEYFDSL